MNNKRLVFLFILRLFFYLSVPILIFIHPAIVIPFDHIGILQWLVIIPLAAIISFLPEKKYKLEKKIIIATIAVFILSIWAGGFNEGMLVPFFSGLLSFTLTYLLFYHPRWGKLSALEPFFLVWVCLRLLSVSRSGEDIAGQSIALTQFILVWTAVVFLLHSVVVYFCLFPKSSFGAGKEGTIFFAGAAAALVLVIFVLPPDFVKNTIVENLRQEEIPEKIKNDSNRGIPMGGGGRREGRRTTPQSEGEERRTLRGISENNWLNRTGRGRNNEDNANSKQYLVMVVASNREPIYLGDVFRGQLHPFLGFQVSQQEQLNRVASQRLFVTWFNQEPNYDTGRRPQDVYSLSTLPQKYLPWTPISIDPTIITDEAGPLRFIHQVTSNTHYGDPLQLVTVPSRPFSGSEESKLAEYLELNLEESDRILFTEYFNKAVRNWKQNRADIIKNDPYLFWAYTGETEYNPEYYDDYNYEPLNKHMETILALMLSFADYQYNLSYTEDVSIAAIREFLFESPEGDCTEFSNTLALLGRIAGIPSRVVTGFLASENLQTPAHLQGLANLQESIPFLQKFPFNNLFMVTNMHGHSWTQFYLPDYGWLDFESTGFSIPPPMVEGELEVIIPVLEEGGKTLSTIKKFPWQAVLRAAIFLVVLGIVGAYALRYGREAVLYTASRKGGRTGARALYLLLLSRLAADGRPIKPASRTAFEYAELFPKISHGNTATSTERPSVSEGSPLEASPSYGRQRHEEELGGSKKHFVAFASLYSELRWKEFIAADGSTDTVEMEKHFELLKQEYQNILLTSYRQGALNWFKRLLSLRGLAYL
jgi:thiamine transporter ThiT